MRNPRIIFTISQEAKDALQRVNAKSGKLEADLLREAISDLLAKYGEKNIDVSVNRGGYRERSEA